MSFSNRKIIPILAVEIAILSFVYLYFCREAGSFGFPLDDSWIHAHFARNIAEGKGIVYNPGQHVTSTAILYTLILAGLYKITGSPVTNAIVLGLLLHLSSALLVYMIARRLSMTAILSTTAAVFFAAIPRLMWGALSGMEVPLYVFLVCLGVYWHVRYTWYDGGKAYLPSFAFGLAALARPECAAFLVCSIIDRAINYVRFERSKVGIFRFIKTLPIHIAIFVAILAPAATYNYVSYGKPLPPAFYAKTRQLGRQHTSAPAKIALYLHETSIVLRRDNVILVVLLIPGLVGCIKMGRRSDNNGMLILPLSLILIPIATAFAAPMGPHRSLAQLMAQHGRYSSYLCPLLTIIGALGIAELQIAVDNIRGAKPWLGRATTRIVIAAIAMTLMSSDLYIAHRYALEVQNINDMQVALGKWAVGLPRNTVVAINDAGAIPYFSRLRILETVGVVNPEVLPYLNKYRSREPGLLEYLQERKPDYVIIFPNWYPHIAARKDILHPIKSIRLKHNLICGGPEMVVYRPTWK